MTENGQHNDQIPTDPTLLAVLLLTTAAVIGRLTTDQAQALTAVIGLLAPITPHLIPGRR
jgi:hypothetical protein